MLNVYLRFDFNAICKKIVQKALADLELKFSMERFGEVHFTEKMSDAKFQQVTDSLNEYGISIVENQKSIVIEKIKEVINQMVFSDDRLAVKSSVYLSEKLNMSYGHISNLFSEITYTSIENYIIIQKIEYAKQLITSTTLTLTEIAFKLNYSSVAHLSTQFKNTTGLTPSAFQRIIQKRRSFLN